MLEEIERLTRLVSHLLFLCREDTGIGVSDFQPVRLDDLVRDVGEHMEVAAREKGLDLAVDLPDACEIKGEPDRLRQLFFNLLDNAIKYTPPGGRVTVEGEPSNGQARVTVTDTGIGIPDEHLPHVFERFYRVDSSRSPETDGNGLGLAICCSIAESHAGRLAIESTLGSGTRVTVVLPHEAMFGRCRFRRKVWPRRCDEVGEYRDACQKETSSRKRLSLISAYLLDTISAFLRGRSRIYSD